jgi:hypothetical protein
MELVSVLKSVESVVGAGKGVVSADNGVVVGMVQETLRSGRTATFYVSPAQAQAVMRWYWTPRRIQEIGYEAVSQGERERIESELGITCAGSWFSNRVDCPECGATYGMFEFMQQGLREHDRDWVKAVLALRNTSVLRINQALDALCADCNGLIIRGHWYGMHGRDGTLIYGCCSGEIPA